LSDSILATGFFYDRGEMMRRTLQQIQTFFEKPIRGIRRTGSAALDQCYVAAGRLDGFWELRLSPWDYAAGALIISEAGGRMTDIAGNPFDLFMRNVLASNGRIHEDMLAVVSG
jgi:myo-inositol-1(or 4)-monophosphatase